MNLWAGEIGAPLRYGAVDALVRRTRARVGFDFHPHMFRHTHATELLRSDVSIEVVSKRLGHGSVAVTSQTYSHLLPEDLRAAIERSSFRRVR